MSSSHITIVTVGCDVQLVDRLKEISNDLDLGFHSSSPEDYFASAKSKRSQILVLSSTSLIHDPGRKDLLNRIDSTVTQIILVIDPEHVEDLFDIHRMIGHQYAKHPLSRHELVFLIENARRRLRFPEQRSSKTKTGKWSRCGPLLGKSGAMKEVYRQIYRAAGSDIHVLISGETGSGKDLAAQAIHEYSTRKDEVFIPVNLAAMPPELVASELFGHEKGAFTGASAQHEGKFEQADKGTVFLDEIGSIENRVQVSLLRLIDQSEFYRLGGKDPIKCTARLIAASNEDLEAFVREGLFREDLYYRLDVFRIHMPPLREHKEDIPLLAFHFLNQFNEQLSKTIQSISSGTLEALSAYDWPGNIRELKNVIQRAAIMCPGRRIEMSHLPARFYSQDQPRPTLEFEIGTPLEEIERRTVIRALELAQQNRTQAARMLGISRRALYNKIEKYNLGAKHESY